MITAAIAAVAPTARQGRFRRRALMQARFTHTPGVWGPAPE